MQFPIATLILIGVNVMVFLLMFKEDPAALTAPSAELLIRAGANFGPLTVNGQFWRLLSSSFVHVGILHLLMNLLALNRLGSSIEQHIGSIKYSLIYFISALTGSLVSMYFHPIIVSAGASGAIFGLIGADFVSMCAIYRHMPKSLFITEVLQAGLLIGFYLTVGLFFPNIDNFCHLGGLVGGFVSALALLPLRSNSKNLNAWNLAGIAAIMLTFQQAIITVFSWTGQKQAILTQLHTRLVKDSLIKNQPPFWVPTKFPTFALGLGQLALQIPDYKMAVRLADKQIELIPNDGESYYTRAVVQNKHGHLQAAIEDIKKATGLTPKSSLYRITQANYELVIEQLNEASKDANLVLNLDKNNSEAQDILGCVSLRQGHYNHAQIWLNKAIASDSNNGAAYYHRAILRQITGNKLAAQQDFIRASEQKYIPKDWEKQML